jgi:hypothetical protein
MVVRYRDPYMLSVQLVYGLSDVPTVVPYTKNESSLTKE